MVSAKSACKQMFAAIENLLGQFTRWYEVETTGWAIVPNCRNNFHRGLQNDLPLWFCVVGQLNGTAHALNCLGEVLTCYVLFPDCPCTGPCSFVEAWIEFLAALHVLWPPLAGVCYAHQ